VAITRRDGAAQIFTFDPELRRLDLTTLPMA
jgi:hypothetical protein